MSISTPGSCPDWCEETDRHDATAAGGSAHVKEFGSDLVSGIQTIAGFNDQDSRPATVGLFGLQSAGTYLADTDVPPELAREIARLLLQAAEVAESYNARHHHRTSPEPAAGRVLTRR